MAPNKLHLITLIVSFNLFAITVFCQQNDMDTTEIKNNESDDYSYIMLNFSYTNNNMEYLSGVTEKIPSLFSNLSYNSKSGLYAGISYDNYFNIEIQSYDIEIEGGYQKYFNNNFDLDIYYSWHKYTGDSLFEGLNYDHSINLSSGYDIKALYISTDMSYLLGNTNNFFLNINLSKFIIFNKVFFEGDYIMISPSISAGFGTDYWLYEDMSNAEKIPLINSLEQAGYSAEEFSYEGIDLYLPVSYAINSAALTFSYMYKIPGGKYKELEWENRSAFMVSLTWFFNFNKK